ncbi:transposase [Streptomyces sp. NPDC050147]|uniref:transposase n=1 Tax=Streptomyces sp. NPDC050147 TaxID=3155513 RepID=UPI00342F64CD
MRGPSGFASTQWHHGRSVERLPPIRVRFFSPADCGTCPQLHECLSSPKARHREIHLRPRDDYEALPQARKLQTTEEWKDRHKIRAEVEGAVSQAVLVCSLRRARYRGLPRSSLQHQLTGAAVHLIRSHPGSPTHPEPP